MSKFLYSISKTIFTNIENGKLVKEITERKATNFINDGYIIELRSHTNNRIRYHTTEAALAKARTEYGYNPRNLDFFEIEKQDRIDRQSSFNKFHDTIEKIHGVRMD